MKKSHIRILDRMLILKTRTKSYFTTKEQKTSKGVAVHQIQVSLLLYIFAGKSSFVSFVVK